MGHSLDADSQKIQDPPPDQRVFFRNQDNGELGFLVESGGKKFIRLDRQTDRALRVFAPGKWVPQQVRRPLTRLQIAEVAFEADKRLCFFLGLHDLAKRSWLDLRGKKREEWLDVGPVGNEPRKALYDAIHRKMEKFTE